MKMDIHKLLTSNGEQDLIDRYGMNEDSSKWACDLKPLDIGHIIQLVRAARIYTIMHEDDIEDDINIKEYECSECETFIKSEPKKIDKVIKDTFNSLEDFDLKEIVRRNKND